MKPAVRQSSRQPGTPSKRVSSREAPPADEQQTSSRNQQQTSSSTAFKQTTCQLLFVPLSLSLSLFLICYILETENTRFCVWWFICTCSEEKKEAARIKRRGHRLPLPFAVARMRVERGKVRESAGKARENPDACRDLTATVPASHRASLNNTPRPAAAAEQWPAPETMQTDSWSSRLTSDSLYILYTLLYVLYIVYKLSTINVSVNAS